MNIRNKTLAILIAASSLAAMQANAQTYYIRQYVPGSSTPVAALTWKKCANENGYCTLPRGTTIRFGADGVYNTLTSNGGTWCNNATFGDPIKGVVKSCDYLA